MEQSEVSLLAEVRDVADREFGRWHLEHNDRNYGLPHRGRLYGALVVLSNLEAKWQFSDLEGATTTDPGPFFGNRSIRNHTSARISSILTKHGHTHLVPSANLGELGRTSTGTKMAGLEFIALIRNALEAAPRERMDEQGRLLTAYLYDRVASLLQIYVELG